MLKGGEPSSFGAVDRWMSYFAEITKTAEEALLYLGLVILSIAIYHWNFKMILQIFRQCLVSLFHLRKTASILFNPSILHECCSTQCSSGTPFTVRSRLMDAQELSILPLSSTGVGLGNAVLRTESSSFPFRKISIHTVIMLALISRSVIVRCDS